MIDEKILGVFKSSLKKSRADQAELVCEAEEFYLTRFAENLVHQNMGRSDSTIWCRAIIGKKIGVARSNDATREGVSELLDIATEIARNGNDDPDFSSLAMSPRAVKSTGYYEVTSAYPASNRADGVAQIVESARLNGLTCAGTFQTSATALCVVNSLGTEQFDKTSDYKFSLTAVSGDGGSGWCQAAGRDIASFNLLSEAQRALDKASFKGEAARLESGPFTVILEPDAVANLLLLLAFLGFGGKTINQGRSFMSDKFGQPIMGNNITISEDPYHLRIQYMPFDYEGVPRKKVLIVENGIARDGVFDNYFAHLAGKSSTGNALPPDNNYGPYPKAMVMKEGNSTVDDMIKSTPYGIYITRFWYLNYLNPMKTMVTGYTRDGTFLIEDGKITRPIVDMRVQQSILEAFSNVESISSEQRLIPQYATLMLVPFLKINNFNLSAT
jgi:predicted Zn-dependent protease